MDIEKIIKSLAVEFKKEGIDFALIGGLALELWGYVRSTVDIDFMVFLKDDEKLDKILKNIGYERLYKTENVANYTHPLSSLGQVDFLFAHRKYACAIMQRAEPKIIFGHSIKVVRPEDLIGLKIQSSSNDSERADRDKVDIDELIKANLNALNWNIIEEYFRLFKRENEYERISKKYRYNQ